jgi:hypothetical protein
MFNFFKKKEKENINLYNKIIFLENKLNEINSIFRQIISNIGVIYYLSLRKKANKKEKEIIKRAKFFLPNYKIRIIREYSLLPRHLRFPLLIDNNVDLSYLNKYHSLYYFNSYNVDFENNPFEGWEWFRLMSDLELDYVNELIENGRRIFLQYVDFLFKRKNKNKVYIFGTGPSLDKAFNYDFSDGYTIACNTIVKNKNLFNKIKPDFLVATDAIFHFDNNLYANKFREDLKKRLKENKDFKFVFGNIFYPVAIRYFFDYKDRLIGISMKNNIDFNNDLINNYFFPNQGNVLTMVLLPLAATLSKNIFLFGFDGRKKEDKLFWKHAKSASYDNYIRDIIKKHPAFFNHQVPKNNEFKYINENLADKLETFLKNLEEKGYHIVMMHKSYLEPLNKRYSKNFIT